MKTRTKRVSPTARERIRALGRQGMSPYRVKRHLEVEGFRPPRSRTWSVATIEYVMKREGVYSPKPSPRTSRDAEELIVHLFTAGRTKREIRGELTARGIQTATGGRWSDGTIQRVLERHGLWTKARPEEERFADRVSVDPESGCHLWTGATSDGRGRFDVEGRNVLAHQHAYLREHGLDSLPAGHDLHHACRNPRCVNPAHLVLVPRDEHMTLESEEERINISAQDGTLAAELEELAKIDDPAASPPATRVGVLRAKPPARAAA